MSEKNEKHNKERPEESNLNHQDINANICSILYNQGKHTEELGAHTNYLAKIIEGHSKKIERLSQIAKENSENVNSLLKIQRNMLLLTSVLLTVGSILAGLTLFLAYRHSGDISKVTETISTQMPEMNINMTEMNINIALMSNNINDMKIYMKIISERISLLEGQIRLMQLNTNEMKDEFKQTNNELVRLYGLMERIKYQMGIMNNSINDMPRKVNPVNMINPMNW